METDELQSEARKLEMLIQEEENKMKRYKVIKSALIILFYILLNVR